MLLQMAILVWNLKRQSRKFHIRDLNQLRLSSSTVQQLNSLPANVHFDKNVACLSSLSLFWHIHGIHIVLANERRQHSWTKCKQIISIYWNLIITSDKSMLRMSLIHRSSVLVILVITFVSAVFFWWFWWLCSFSIWFFHSNCFGL